MSFNNIAILYIKGNAYRIHFWSMSKDDAINIMMVIIWLINGSFIIFLIIYKKSECNSIEYADLTYYQKTRDVILNREKDHYENDKERLRGQARDKYINLSEEEKDKKENMGRIDITKSLKKKKY